MKSVPKIFSGKIAQLVEIFCRFADKTSKNHS